MKISSEAIQKKEFHIVFKGYKPEEVDDFLDVLAVEFEKMYKKILELQDGLDKLKFEGDKESVEMKNVIEKALVSAHRVADDIKLKAQEEADKMLNAKKIQEEEENNKLVSERKQLEENIGKLKTEYSYFKNQIIRFAEDLREKAAKIDEGETGETSEPISSNNEDVFRHQPGANTPISENKEPEADAPVDEGKLKLDLGNQPDEEEKEIEIETRSEKAVDYTRIEEEKVEEKEVKEKEVKEASEIRKEANELFKTLKKEEDDPDKPKVTRKKIDIANPDIINDFFKTDED